LRFDMPCSGRETIETMYRFGATALALEAEKTISFDRERMITLADEYGIAIVAMTNKDFYP
ncbi:MAG: UDP-2,3-diacylglucosamine diphosphatase LpxI, partial [Desulfarculaceae bacterium]|nr:UDP-2,3-diacylglucosamine diphosphatase LpxI [Desulfarculaceae bacterium]